jgi:hypothetical protein
MMKRLTFMVAFTAGQAFLTIFMIRWGRGHRFGSSVLERLYNLVERMANNTIEETSS